ncbi:DUF3618 domain-containing protein [Mobilicoccus pelagius]|uniref:DUF3618 domain-containing protein n=1 Tax=Mobilicoccus pelagius NBRC 104925 TaxID=1089455 RepID=H5UV96_9MICO|nr:DUF3618 domain-containing protein [Mobilicoccus pelagius]GAB49654.1 hypothetical protein MOPEL_132_00210 [Mobilicoccus pelagius NBRC 104925]
MSAKDNRSLDEIEKDIARNRDDLAATIDELAFRVKPANVAKRQVDEAKTFVDRTARNTDGSLRLEVVGPAVGAVVLLVALAVYNRVRG